MATTSPVQLAQATVAATPTAYYQAPVDGTAIAQETILCNITNKPVTITLSFVRDGDEASAANTILSSFEIPGGQTVFLSQATVLPSQGKIVVSASVSDAVGMTISGIEIV
jgi:hypothetical protein